MNKYYKSIYYSTGKRKTSISKIWIGFNGNGSILINGKNINRYFNNLFYINLITRPIRLLSLNNTCNIECYVYGGGLSSQSGAIAFGISKVLSKIDYKYYLKLRDNKLTTRDSRVVERKKYGRAKSRKMFQFSKR